MASNPDREVLSARMCINLVFTRVSGVFRSSTSFPCAERFSAPLGARKCLSPISKGDDATIFNWAVTLGLPDFGSEGSLLGFIVGQPPKVTDNDIGLEDADTSWHLEAQYRYQLTDNIAINPGVLVILNPEHNNNNDTIWVGTLRTIFEF